MITTTFSVRVGRSTKSRLEKLAKSTGRSRSFLAAEAISAYLDTNEWHIAGITKKRSHLLIEARASPIRASASGSLPGRLAESVRRPRGYDAPVPVGN
jgi:Ribbon-helix-helix protein, copG family